MNDPFVTQSLDNLVGAAICFLIASCIFAYGAWRLFGCEHAPEPEDLKAKEKKWMEELGREFEKRMEVA